jgi:EAL and modified HD-GYP domain-containing signal transduction protein
LTAAAQLFMGRRPIIADERRLLAWDLAFADASGAPWIPIPSAAEADERLARLTQLASGMDWDALSCGARLLLTVDRHTVFSDFVEKLPRNRVWLGLERCDEIDGRLAHRLYALHAQRGCRLVLLDYGRRDPREPLIDLTEAVEFDGLALAPAERDILVRRAHRRSLSVLGRGVDRDQDLVTLRESGFDWIQGRCCLEASRVGETVANEEGRVLLDLLLASNDELEISPVAARIQSNERLSQGLLRLVNSLDLARAQKIGSISQALMMIGAQGLVRWLALLLFQVGTAAGQRGPLFRVAASRGRLMELLTRDREGEGATGKEAAEEAFLVGILSLVHVLLGVDRASAIDGLPIFEDLQLALIRHEGEVGRLLQLVECLEAGCFVEAAALAEELEIPPDRILDRQAEAYEWVLRMIKVDAAG